MRSVLFRRAIWVWGMACCMGLLLYCGCPVYRLTGIPCPGCGLTRAWCCFLAGDWKSAVGYHPLFLAAPFYLLAVVAGDFPCWGACRVRRAFCMGYTALLLGVYLVRYGVPGIL